MPQIIFLPHPDICPSGKIVDAKTGQSILQVALDAGLEIEHACEQVCACSTCHVVVEEGFDSLNIQDELEEDMLDKAWGLEVLSRLSCQAIVGEKDLVVKIPKYSRNQVKEN